MDKPVWKKIDKSTNKPCPRWGHTCCVIGEEIVFFGGYADSNYMNDVWTYNSATTRWEEIITTGDRPSHRSNCSMNYDPTHNCIVVFGGGGPNKQRFNSVNILDWSTKHWVEIAPKENEQAPWERTYHTAQLKYPYLIVFGGEGVADLDDLWLFNFNTLSWTEVKFEKDSLKPYARRFHSSSLIGNELFIVAGCHSKYRCLSDVYSLDFTPLLATGKTEGLQWVERKVKGASFLTRWGHSAAVFDGKIYIFAGRFSNDLNDLLIIDPISNTIRGKKICNASQTPKARRRHCAGFVGSCMIVFGGFNGEYFNDLHYINVFQYPSRLESTQTTEEVARRMISDPSRVNHFIKTVSGESVPIQTALLARYFRSEIEFVEFLQQLNDQYSKENLLNLLECLYRGYGKVEEDDIQRKYGIKLPQYQNRKLFVNILIEEEENNSNFLRKTHQLNEKFTESVLVLKRGQFGKFLENRRRQWFCDTTIIVNHSTQIRANRFLLSLSSRFFEHAFSGKYEEREDYLQIFLQKDYSIVSDVLINFMMTGLVVVPLDFSRESWMELCQLGEYFSIPQLKNISQSQLCQKISLSDLACLQRFSEQMQLNTLALHCAWQQIQTAIKMNDLRDKVAKLREEKDSSKQVFLNLYDVIKFDLNHYVVPLDSKELGLKKKKESQHMIQEKQNREYNNF